MSSRKGEIANTMVTAARLQEKCKSLIRLASQNVGKHDDKIDDFRRIITRNFKCNGGNLKPRTGKVSATKCAINGIQQC